MQIPDISQGLENISRGVDAVSQLSMNVQSGRNQMAFKLRENEVTQKSIDGLINYTSAYQGFRQSTEQARLQKPNYDITKEPEMYAEFVDTWWEENSDTLFGDDELAKESFYANQLLPQKLATVQNIQSKLFDRQKETQRLKAGGQLEAIKEQVGEGARPAALSEQINTVVELKVQGGEIYPEQQASEKDKIYDDINYSYAKNRILSFASRQAKSNADIDKFINGLRGNKAEEGAAEQGALVRGGLVSEDKNFTQEEIEELRSLGKSQLSNKLNRKLEDERSQVNEAVSKLDAKLVEEGNLTVNDVLSFPAFSLDSTYARNQRTGMMQKAYDSEDRALAESLINEYAGMEPKEFEKAWEGLDQFHDQEYGQKIKEAILENIQKPEMDGYVTQQNVRRQAEGYARSIDIPKQERIRQITNLVGNGLSHDDAKSIISSVTTFGESSVATNALEDIRSFVSETVKDDEEASRLVREAENLFMSAFDEEDIKKLAPEDVNKLKDQVISYYADKKLRAEFNLFSDEREGEVQDWNDEDTKELFDFLGRTGDGAVNVNSESLKPSYTKADMAIRNNIWKEILPGEENQTMLNNAVTVFTDSGILYKVPEDAATEKVKQGNEPISLDDGTGKGYYVVGVELVGDNNKAKNKDLVPVVYYPDGSSKTLSTPKTPEEKEDTKENYVPKDPTGVERQFLKNVQSGAENKKTKDKKPLPSEPQPSENKSSKSIKPQSVPETKTESAMKEFMKRSDPVSTSNTEEAKDVLEKLSPPNKAELLREIQYFFDMANVSTIEIFWDEDNGIVNTKAYY